MPRFDDQAYAEKRCYGGISEAALGQDLPPLPPGSLLQREIEALVDFLQAKIIGAARSRATNVSKRSASARRAAARNIPSIPDCRPCDQGLR